MTEENTESRREARFKFKAGEIVQLIVDQSHLALKAGDQGYVWGLYDTDPPMYEADFYRLDGSGIAMMFTADQVELVSDPYDIRIPGTILKFWSNAKPP